MKVALDKDREFVLQLNKLSEDGVRQDLARYPGESITVNGETLSKDEFFELGKDFDSVKTSIDNLFLKHNIDIVNSVAAKTLFLGFHQQGLLHATACSVIEVASFNGFFPTPLGAVRTLEQIKDIEKCVRRPSLQTMTYHEIYKKTGSENIKVTETVKMLRKGEVCGIVKTDILITKDGQIKYQGTNIKLTKEGLKVIPDTRSLLEKIKEKFLYLLSNILGRKAPVSTFNFFAGKQNVQNINQHSYACAFTQ